MKIEINHPDYSRIRWQCSRRGMLELDMLLSRFFEQRFTQLSESLQQQFIQLLEQPDPVLWDWFFGDAIPCAPAYSKIVAAIKENHPS